MHSVDSRNSSIPNKSPTSQHISKAWLPSNHVLNHGLTGSFFLRWLQLIYFESFFSTLARYDVILISALATLTLFYFEGFQPLPAT